MNTRRWTLLSAVPLFLIAPFLGAIGGYELLVLLALAALWLYGFLVWARN